MQLNVEISQAAFEKPTRQARKAGISVEIAAGNKLSECLAGNAETSGVLSRHWIKEGTPWNLVAADDIAACYRRGICTQRRKSRTPRTR